MDGQHSVQNAQRQWQDLWCNGGGLFTPLTEEAKHMEVLADLHRVVAKLKSGGESDGQTG